MYPYLLLPLMIALLAGAAATQQKPEKDSPASAARPTRDSAPVAELPSEEVVTSFLRQTFGYDPNMTWKITNIRPAAAESLAEVSVLFSSAQGQQTATLYVTPDGKHALVGDLIPFGADPFGPARDALQKGINGVSRGPANAPVTIVEFSDLQCPHCKDAEPTLDKILADEPDARLVFQQFPLPTHDWAAKAADYADCVGRANNAAFWKFVQGVFHAQSDITQANADEKLTSIAEASSANGADIAACAAKPDTKTRVDSSIALGKSVDVTGTPTLFINGRKIANVNSLPYDLFKKLVEFGAKPKESK